MSSRRPPLVQVEMSSPNAIPKLRVNKYRCFLEVMGAWYRDLSRKEKKHITTKRFKRRALLELERLQYEYKSLPANWVTILVNKYGVKLNDQPTKDTSGAANGGEKPSTTTPTEGRKVMKVTPRPAVKNGGEASSSFPDYTHKLMRGGLDRVRLPSMTPDHEQITLSWLLDRSPDYQPRQVYNQLMMQIEAQKSSTPSNSDRFNNGCGEEPTQANPEFN